jgi:PAS domain S-box-containing protein
VKNQKIRFNSLFSDLVEGAILVDNQKKIIAVNKVVCELLNKPENLITGKQLNSFFSGLILNDRNWNRLLKNEYFKKSIQISLSEDLTSNYNINFSPDFFPGHHILLLKPAGMPKVRANVNTGGVAGFDTREAIYDNLQITGKPGKLKEAGAAYSAGIYKLNSGIRANKTIINYDSAAGKEISNIKKIIDIKELQHIQDVFSTATGVAAIITDPDGIPITKPSNFCRLCKTLIRKSEEGRELCYKVNAELGMPNQNGPIIKPCPIGLLNAGASITLQNKHIANFLIGQVRSAKLKDKDISGYADTLGVDKNKFAKLMREIPVFDEVQFNNIAYSVFLLASKLSSLANKNIEQAGLITELNKTKEELFEKQENLLITLNSIGDGVISTDRGGNIVSMNPVAEKLTGWCFSEAKDKKLTEVFKIVNVETRKPVSNPVNKVLKKGMISGLANHTILIAKDGRERQIADSAAPILTGNGKITGVVLVFSDVTEQSASRKALQESEKALRESQKIAGLGTFVLDINNGDWKSTEIFDNIHGIDKHYVKDLKGWISLFHPEWNNEIREYFFNEVLKKKKPFDKEYKIVRVNDGKERWIYGIGRLVFDKNGSPVTMIGTVKDITERHESRELLEQSEEKFKTLFYNSHAVLLITDMENGNIIDANKAACNFYGWKYEELLRKKIYEINISQKLSIENTKRIKAGETSCFFSKHKSKNGEVHNVEVYCGFITLNKKVYAFNIIHDITDRTLIENKLKESQVRLKNIFEAAPVGIGVIKNRVITEINETLCRITGYSREELINQNTRLLYLSDADYKKTGIKKHKLASRKGVGNLEIKWQHKNKSILYLLLSIVAIDNNDLSQGITFTVLDITELKKAELEIKRKDENYKNTIENIIRFTPEGMLVFKNNYELFSQNKAFDNLVKKYADRLGYTESELKEILLKEVSGKLADGSKAVIKIGNKNNKKISHT